MQLGMVGLGRMGANIVRRLMRKGHSCVVFDQTSAAVAALEKEGAIGAWSLDELVAKLERPRAVWVMVPAGVTETVVKDLASRLERDDVVIDGGNSYFRDDRRRAREFASLGLHYVDCGTSGGIWGLERGYCLMIGGEAPVVQRLDPIFQAIAPGRGDVPRTPGREKRGGTAEEGYLHCGAAGAGHFVKMVHNGIEYGLMAAFAEGLDILKNADVHTRETVVDAETAPTHGRDLDYKIEVADVAELWRRGSVVGSWLLDLAAAALVESPDLAEYSGRVADSGEGRWAVETAIEAAVPAEVLTSALYSRFRSRQDHTFAEKVCSAMRYKFGGHVERATGG